jgi:uncharacterized protein (TIRG00374 family)
MKTLDLKYIAVAVLFMGMFLFLEALMLDILVNINGRKTAFKVAIKSMFIGQFYSLVTPFSSGGQPMQLFAMMKDGLKASHSTAVLVNKFLYFQVGVTLFSLTLVILKWSSVIGYLTASYGVIALGLTFNTLGLTLLLLMVFKPNKLKVTALKLIACLRWFKVSEIKIKAKQNKCCEHVNEFTHNIKGLLVNRLVMFKMSVLTIVQLIFYFGITYFIYRAFGQTEKSFVEILALQSVLYMSISLIPTPGSAGVAEGGFYFIFSSLFPAGTVAGGMLIWRGISYYLNLLVSGIITMYISAKEHVFVEPNLQIIKKEEKRVAS